MEYAILFLPLLGSIIGYFGRSLAKLFSEITTSLFISISAIFSIIVFWNGIENDSYNNYVISEWITSGNFTANWSINIDPLSSVMLVVVTFVSALVHIYSIGYMSHDPHKPRFMSYLSLFTFSMLALVVPDNFLLIPGVGAQGGDLEETFKNGVNKNIGILVNSSRSIIYAGNDKDFLKKSYIEAKRLQAEMNILLDNINA